MSVSDAPTVDRSWTDALTNRVVLRGMNGAEYLKWFARRETRIEPVIPQFMHECAHFWCFDSLVGRVIALLRMRAAFAMLFKRSSSSERDAATDISKHVACSIMLTPISEGLALFAECDTLSGQSSVNSLVILALQICFGFPLKGKKGQDISQLALLQGTRMTRDFLEDRKASLYFKPFDCKDGYLPGYLSIKALHSRLKLRVPDLFDPDLFFSFVRAYFYEDCLLAEALLSHQNDEVKAAEAVARRIQGRVADLLRDEDLPSRVELFAKSIANGQPDVALTDGIGIDSKDHRRVTEECDRAITALVAQAPRDDEHMRLVAGVILASIELRQFIIVASTSVTLSRDVEGNLDALSESGEKLATIQKDRITPNAGEKSELMVVFDISDNCLFQAIKAGENVAIAKEFGDVSDTSREALRTFVTTQDLNQQVVDLLEEALVDLIKESWLKVIVDHVTKNTVRIATALYLSVATLNVKEEDLVRVKGMLLEKGLRPFIRDDPTLARVLAAIGLVNTVSNQISTIEGLSQALLRLNADEFRESIEQLRIHTGLPLLLQSEDKLFALV